MIPSGVPDGFSLENHNLLFLHFLSLKKSTAPKREKKKKRQWAICVFFCLSVELITTDPWLRPCLALSFFQILTPNKFTIWFRIALPCWPLLVFALHLHRRFRFVDIKSNGCSYGLREGTILAWLRVYAIIRNKLIQGK